jgi:hypothetical protein
MTDVTTEQDQEQAGLSAADQQLLRELTERARAGGLKLAGEGGLLDELTKMVVEGALEGEMDDHLGYGRHDPAGRNSGNSRNGRRAVDAAVGAVHVHALPAWAGDGARGRGAAAGRAGVANRDDVGLDGGVGRVARVTRSDHAFEEGADVVVVPASAGAEHDRAFLVHRRVPVGQGPVPVGGQGAGLRIAALEFEGRLPRCSSAPR